MYLKNRAFLVNQEKNIKDKNQSFQEDQRMNAVFCRSQQKLDQIQGVIRQRLEEIQYLDVQCLRMQCRIQQLRQDYLQQIKWGQITNHDEPSTIYIEDIAKLEEQLRQTAQKKVTIAEEIERMVGRCSAEIEKQMFETAEQLTVGVNFREFVKQQHLLEFGMGKAKGKQQQIMNPEIRAIVKEYYDEKESQNTYYGQSYCTCQSTGKKLYSGNMIECENPKCKIGWYHFQCVGIKFDAVPKNWICESCQSELRKINKITFQHQNSKVQVQIHHQQGIEKRKKGRPRKYPKVQQKKGSE